MQGSIELEVGKDIRGYFKEAYIGVELGQRKCISCVYYFKRW